MAKVGKRKNVEPAGSGLKAKRQQKKNNVNNGVLKERLADIGVFKNTTGKTMIADLLEPQNEASFFADIYEKKHLLIARNTNEKLVRNCNNLFNKERLQAIAKLEKLLVVRDFNLTKTDSEGLSIKHQIMEEYPDCDVPTDFGDYANIMKLVNDQKYTLQLRQPQRFCDDFWRIICGLEESFGSLVGSDVYWTPTKSLETPPQWDNEDNFVLQLNGSQTFKLWKNSQMELPPSESPPDLIAEELGAPIDTLELTPGDLLYLPRGMIFSRIPTKTDASIHTTFSMNRSNSTAHWLSANFSSLANNLAEEHLFLRRSVPRNICDANVRLEWLKNTLKEITEKLDENMMPKEDPLRKDFFANRLPPYKQPGTFGKLKQIDLNCEVKLTSKEHIYIYEADNVDEDGEESDDSDDEFSQEDLANMAEMDDRDDEETPGQEMGIKGMDGWKRIPVDGNSAELDSGNGDEFKDLEGEMEDEEEIVVMHSWQNERKNHMVTQSEPKLIKFPLAYKDSLQKLLDLKDGEYILLSELDLPASEAVQFSVALWAEGLLMPKDQ